jgi:MraZ protein
MLKSKPIGWITAGTLVCLAGVALACRLRDGKAVPAEANASPWSAKEDPAPVARPSPKASTSAKLPARAVLLASQATLTEAPAAKKDEVSKPKVGEKVEDQEPPAPAAEGVPPPPPVTTPPEKPVVPLPGAAADEEKTPSVPAPPGAGAPSVPVLTPPPDSVREPQTNLGMPTLKVSGAIRPVKAESKPTEPLCAEAPEAKPETSEKKAAATPSPEKPTEAPAPPPVPATPSGKVVPEVPAGKPAEAPVAAPAPPPVPSTCPSPGKPAPMPPTGQAESSPPTPAPTYKVGDKGETLREIAKRTLGSEGRWTEIDKLNPELRSESVVPAGKVVRLPVDAHVGGNVPGGAETQGMPPTKALSVRPLPVVRPKKAETKASVSAPLTGTYSCKLEDKRSLVLPKEVCAQLDKAETVLLTPGPDQCLWLGTQASAARVLERVEKSGAAEQEVQTFRRLYYSQSEKASLDGSGKLVVAEKLAEYAGLGKEVVLIGIDDHFELWDAARWQRYSQHKDASPKP